MCFLSIFVKIWRIAIDRRILKVTVSFRFHNWYVIDFHKIASISYNISWYRNYSDIDKSTGDTLHSRAACTQPCNVNTHSRAPGARLCEQWEHGCVNNGARLCASARLCRGSPVKSYSYLHNEKAITLFDHNCFIDTEYQFCLQSPFSFWTTMLSFDWLYL